MEDHSPHGSHGGPNGGTGGYAATGHAVPGGLAVAANGLRLDPAETRFEAGATTEWTFRIVDADGEAVTEFEETHGKRGHLVVVRRDLTHFQHRHPVLAPDGTWRVADFELPDPGVYRAFVDVVVAGQPTTLGFDLFTARGGPVAPRPTDASIATAGDYEVELLTPDVTSGEATELQFEVRRDGDPVPELGEYLGALGHLVAIREGDLAYLHVHPEVTDPDSGRVEFAARFPTPGRYRLFLQTRPERTLLTTQFDVRVER